MKVKYLNYEKAVALCQRYQHLKGTPYDKDHPEDATVQAVLVAPYSRILQWKFVLFLSQGWTATDALAINVNERYDVLVIPEKLQEKEGEGLRFKHLRDHLQEHGIAVNVIR